MLKPKIVDVLENGRATALAISDRIRTGLAGRSRLVIALATLAGVSTIGIAAAALDNTPSATLTTAAAADADRQRAEAADQANRSTRESQTPASATETPSAAPGSMTMIAPSATKTSAPSASATTKAAPAWVNPMPKGELSSCFGPRWGTQHQGIDLFAAENENIVAVGKGKIVAAGWAYSGYGISVVIDHGNGFLTHYAHLNKAAVNVGQDVGTGTLIGYEGSTGDSTGPHLHFEVHAGMWNQINPAPWLRDRGVQIGC